MDFQKKVLKKPGMTSESRRPEFLIVSPVFPAYMSGRLQTTVRYMLLVYWRVRPR